MGRNLTALCRGLHPDERVHRERGPDHDGRPARPAGRPVIGRALVVWFLLVVLAVLNGGVRDTWLGPGLGDTVGRAISSIMLAVLILLATWLTIAWIGPRTTSQALALGAMWLGLTLTFEFGAGHYAFGNSWAELLADYDLGRGRIWILVLIVTLVAPVWTARLRGLLG